MQLNSHQPRTPSSNLEPGLPTFDWNGHRGQVRVRGNVHTPFFLITDHDSRKAVISVVLKFGQYSDDVVSDQHFRLLKFAASRMFAESQSKSSAWTLYLKSKLHHSGPWKDGSHLPARSLSCHQSYPPLLCSIGRGRTVRPPVARNRQRAPSGRSK